MKVVSDLLNWFKTTWNKHQYTQKALAFDPVTTASWIADHLEAAGIGKGLQGVRHKKGSDSLIVMLTSPFGPTEQEIIIPGLKGRMEWCSLALALRREHGIFDKIPSLEQSHLSLEASSPSSAHSAA